MLWDFIGFGVFTGGYLMLSLTKTLERQRAAKTKQTLQTTTQIEIQTMFADENAQTAPPVAKQKPKFDKKVYTKKIINYCVAFNSSFLIVGSMSESYFYSITIVGNILSVLLGFIYAFLIVHPFMYSLDKEIKTPYQYYEKRYRSKIIRTISAIMDMFFYFSFLTLFLWGSTILLSTLLPDVPLWVSTLIIGTYSLLGSSIGGFQQTTIINVFQFLIVLSGLITAMALTVTKSKNSLQELWNFASLNGRANFFELRTDIKIRYTLLNQMLSLSLPWCTFHSLLLPNFTRYRSIHGKYKSRLLMVSSLPVMVLVNFIIFVSGGFLCYVFFYGCDPFKSQKIPNKNETGTYWLYLILSVYAPALTGLIFSSIICYSIMQACLLFLKIKSTLNGV